VAPSAPCPYPGSGRVPGTAGPGPKESGKFRAETGSSGPNPGPPTSVPGPKKSWFHRAQALAVRARRVQIRPGPGPISPSVESEPKGAGSPRDPGGHGLQGPKLANLAYFRLPATPCGAGKRLCVTTFFDFQGPRHCNK